MADERKTGAVRRILRLWKIHAWLDVMSMTRDLKTFSMWYLSDMAMNIASVTGMLLLAARFDGIGAWTRPQILFMLSYAAVVGGIMSMFFNYNLAMISRTLGRGQLDHTLIQPQPIWMSLLTEGFSPLYGSSMLLPGLGLMLWAGSRLPLPHTPFWVAALIMNLLASTAVLVSFQYFWGSLAFWAPRAAEEINSSTMTLIEQLKSFPLDGVGAALTGGLLTVLPTGFLAWMPCRALLGLDGNPLAVWRTPLIAPVFAALAAAMFRKGLAHYGRTGSQRYSPFGHRC